LPLNQRGRVVSRMALVYIGIWRPIIRLKGAVEGSVFLSMKAFRIFFRTEKKTEEPTAMWG